MSFGDDFDGSDTAIKFIEQNLYCFPDFRFRDAGCGVSGDFDDDGEFLHVVVPLWLVTGYKRVSEAELCSIGKGDNSFVYCHISFDVLEKLRKGFSFLSAKDDQQHQHNVDED